MHFHKMDQKIGRHPITKQSSKEDEELPPIGDMIDQFANLIRGVTQTQSERASFAVRTRHNKNRGKS